MDKRRAVTSASRYESVFGFSRAVRVGQMVAVAGTAPIGPDGRTVGVGDAAAQARRCLEICREALAKLDASLADVVRTRMMLVQRQDWEAVARVHGEFFRDIRPAATLVQVAGFIDPDWLVEVEVDAVVTPREEDEDAAARPG